MTDALPAPASTSAANDRDELVERLKAEAAALREQKAQAEARSEVYEQRHRAELESYVPEAKYFMQEFVMNLPEVKDDAACRAEIAPLATWAEEFAGKKDIGAQTALARTMVVASKGIKRTLDQASRLTEVETTMATTMQENESLKAEVAKLQKESVDNKTLLDERQAGLERLQAEITKAGLAAEKFDFSILSSREKVPEPSATEQPAASGVTQVTAQASRSTNANPMDRADPLLSSLLSNNDRGSTRMNPSASGHSWLSAENQGSDIAAMLRR